MYDLDLFSLDDIDVGFDRIIQLKQNQSVAMKRKGFVVLLKFTTLPAGNLIGEKIRKIVKEEEEDIVKQPTLTTNRSGI